MSESRIDLVYESPVSGDVISSPPTFYSPWFSSNDRKSVLAAVVVTDSAMKVGIEETVDPSAGYPLRLTPLPANTAPVVGTVGGNYQTSGEVMLIGRYYRLIVSIVTIGANTSFWATLRGKF
jgi:hypothetical protein